jgi:two-component system CheB/CheR fusion protein
MTTISGPQFETLLEYLREARGFDLTGYKRPSLARRVDRRMAQVKIDDYGDYQDYLEVHPEEFNKLIDTVLINVTGFFRDLDVWRHVGAEVLTPSLRALPAGAPIRAWCAGCASGEEAYTLAMVLAEVLGIDEFRHRVKIYATDVDEDGLARARLASYGERDLSGVPPELVERYFSAGPGNRLSFRKDLRRSVIFGRNDLVQDAPISRINVLTCRNTLMYFNAETQARILNRFHFALADGGVLFLGKAEMLFSHADLFTPIDLKRRVFRKSSRTGGEGQVFVRDTVSAPSPPDRGRADRLLHHAFLVSPVAQIVITPDGLVVLANRQAEALFGVSDRDIGRPFRDLDVSFRPAELRSHIDQVQRDRKVTRVPDVEYSRSGGLINLEIELHPLLDSDLSLLGLTLAFTDITAARRLLDDLELANRQLESAYEELQSTNEELETTNEERQSTVEELETTNEELQSTVEELETTNEELQSTNDELQTINERLHESTAKLDSANEFLAAILTSLRSGVAVVDRDLRVQIWNRRAEDLWGLRAEEAVGEHLLNLDIGLPTGELRPLVRRVLGGEEAPQDVRLAAINRRGRPLEVRVVCTALSANGHPVEGAILLMESAEPDGRAN